MWSLWHRSKSLSCRPSQLLEVEDSLAAYSLDSATVVFGTIVENALSEREKTGSGKNEEWRAKYTLDEILDADFFLPRPPSRLQKRRQSAADFFVLATQPGSGVKMWREVAPATGQQPQGKVN